VRLIAFQVMPPAVASLANRLPLAGAVARYGTWRIALVVLPHAAALALMAATESGAVSVAAFLLTWGLLNFLWLAVLRRPAAAAALSLAMFVVLLLLSRLKHSILFMTVNFVDLMIIDLDTFAFLLTIYPGLGSMVALALALMIPALALVWWIDPLRVSARSALAGALGCLVGLVGASWSAPSDPYDEFYSGQYVSKFARSGVAAVEEYLTRGLFEADARLTETLKPAATGACAAAGKSPHIVMVFDESSFDISVVQGLKLPADYREYFASFDGRMRSLVVEGVSGPSWFTEYNVLTGLSVRSYGRFADFVTRIAAGRVERGLPHALARCGYKTISHYPFHGAFLSARRFQTSAGIQKFLDAKELGGRGIEPDGFYYDAALRTIERERGEKPLFLFIYTLANHFPWDVRFRPELTPEWRDLGNGTEADEYLRRQAMSARDYAAFRAELARKFPGEPFLIVRFGDHQPSFARSLIDPALDDSFMARQIAQQNPRFLTTYYALDAVNFRPVDTASAAEVLDAPYLPLAVLEAAGLPLDPSFAEQKTILKRCRGLFYRCAGGAEARRFNRLLIDAGLIKGL
jgi:phosphoglycerol transferase MdoB-like AlkP superfamily enzyme